MATYWHYRWSQQQIDFELWIYPGGAGDFNFATATRVDLNRGALVNLRLRWQYDTLPIGMPQLPRLELEFDIRRTDSALLQLLLQPEVDLGSDVFGGAVVRLDSTVYVGNSNYDEAVGEFIVMKGATYTGKTLKVTAEHAYSVALQYVDLREHTLGIPDAQSKAFRLYAVRDSKGEVFFYDKEPDGFTNFWTLTLPQWHQHLQTKALSVYLALVRRSTAALSLGQFEQEFQFYKQTAAPGGALGAALTSADVEFVAFSYSKTGALNWNQGLLKQYGSAYDYFADWAEMGLLRWWSWQDVGLSYSRFWDRFRWVALEAKDVLKADVKLYDLVISGIVVSMYDQLGGGIRKVERTVRYGTQSKRQLQVPVWFHTMPTVVDSYKKVGYLAGGEQFARAPVLLSSVLYYRGQNVAIEHYDMIRVHEYADVQLGAGKKLSDYAAFTPFDRSGLDYWEPGAMRQVAEHSFVVRLAEMLQKIFANQLTVLDIEVPLDRLVLRSALSGRHLWAMPGQAVKLPLQQIDSFLPAIEWFVMVSCEADLTRWRAKVQLMEQTVV